MNSNLLTNLINEFDEYKDYPTEQGWLDDNLITQKEFSILTSGDMHDESRRNRIRRDIPARKCHRNELQELKCLNAWDVKFMLTLFCNRNNTEYKRSDKQRWALTKIISKMKQELDLQKSIANKKDNGNN